MKTKLLNIITSTILVLTATPAIAKNEAQDTAKVKLVKSLKKVDKKALKAKRAKKFDPKKAKKAKVKKAVKVKPTAKQLKKASQAKKTVKENTKPKTAKKTKKKAELSSLKTSELKKTKVKLSPQASFVKDINKTFKVSKKKAKKLKQKKKKAKAKKTNKLKALTARGSKPSTGLLNKIKTSLTLSNSVQSIFLPSVTGALYLLAPKSFEPQLTGSLLSIYRGTGTLESIKKIKLKGANDNSSIFSFEKARSSISKIVTNSVGSVISGGISINNIGNYTMRVRKLPRLLSALANKVNSIDGSTSLNSIGTLNIRDLSNGVSFDVAPRSVTLIRSRNPKKAVLKGQFNEFTSSGLAKGRFVLELKQ